MLQLVSSVIRRNLIAACRICYILIFTGLTFRSECSLSFAWQFVDVCRTKLRDRRQSSVTVHSPSLVRRHGTVCRRMFGIPWRCLHSKPLRKLTCSFDCTRGCNDSSGLYGALESVYVLRRHRSCRDYYYYIIIKAPQYLKEYCISFSDTDSRQRLRSASSHLLSVPRHRGTLGR